MKRIAAVALTVLLLFASASIPVSAQDPAYNEGDILYTQDFSDFSAVTASPDYAVHGYAYNEGACATLGCENGALRIDSSNTSTAGTIYGRCGTRVSLYDIPESVDEFSVSLDIYINEYHANASSYGPGLLLADSGVSDTAPDGTEASFSMIWLRPFGKGATGAYTYGGSPTNVTSQTKSGFCAAGAWYTVEVYVNKTTSAADFRITNKSTGRSYSSDFIYNQAALNPVVGIYDNGCDILADNLTVYYGNALFKPVEGETLYEQGDSLDYNSVYGYAYKKGYYDAFGCEDGKLHVASLNTYYSNDVLKTGLGGRYGTRINLYEVPNYVDRFTVSCDIYINEYYEVSASHGPGLLLADNGISTTAQSTSNDGLFSMIWMRQYNKGATGAYTYGGVAADNTVSPTQAGFCTAGAWYNVQVYIDKNNNADKVSTFKLTNKSTGAVYEAKFIYNKLLLNPIVGLYVNGCDVLVDNFSVYYGDGIGITDKYKTEEINKIQSVDLTLGADLTVRYYATAPTASDVSMELTMLGNSVTLNGTGKGIERRFDFTQVAPQCIGETITAKLYVDNTLIETKTYSVLQYCNALLAGSPSAELSTLIADLLEYGAAAQRYLDPTVADADLVNYGITGKSEFIVPASVRNVVTESNADTTTTHFDSAGMRFNNTNMLYFKFTAPAGFRITVNDIDLTANASSTEAGKYILYTSAITAVNFARTYTVKLYNGNTLIQTLTYSVNSFVSAMYQDDNANAAALVKATCNYGRSAEAYRNAQ